LTLTLTPLLREAKIETNGEIGIHTPGRVHFGSGAIQAKRADTQSEIRMRLGTLSMGAGAMLTDAHAAWSN